MQTVVVVDWAKGSRNAGLANSPLLPPGAVLWSSGVLTSLPLVKGTTCDL